MNDHGTDDRRLLSLAAAGRRFSTLSSLDELFTVAAELALEVLDADSVSIGRIEPERGVLRILRNRGALAEWEEPEPVDEVYDVSEFPSIAAAVDDAGPWCGHLDDPDLEPRHVELLQSMDMYAAIEVPVVVASRVWGEVGGARRARRPVFTTADVAAAEAFSGLLAAAIARIAERDELHALAYRDDLTGLGNRRWVDERLEQLFATDPLPVPVAAILCDVDGLKRVNDRHGHDAGDRLLRAVASLLSQAAGPFPGSLAARLGGDEFCLLLEGVSEIEVQAATDQLAAEAANLPMGGGLSCGWAIARSRPGDASTTVQAARALLRLADAAQYRVKRAGREAAPAHAIAHAVGVDTSEQSTRIADTALAGLAAVGDEIGDRLEVVAGSLAQVLDASGWAVSLSVDGGPVTIVRSGDGRRFSEPGATPEAALQLGAAWDLADYPATAAALEGGSLHATMDHGEPSEREFLAANGYDEIIGAGAPETDGRAWLVEVVGDAMSAPLGPHRGLLRVLVDRAISGAAWPASPAVTPGRSTS